MIDIDSYEDYKLNVAGVDTVLPRIIEMSDRYGIRLTVATVGFLMCKDKKEMAEYSPERISSYLNKSLQPYGAYQDTKVGENGDEDRLHYASDLISLIHHPHEIASHTFCHYYCMAPGQSKEECAVDLGAAVQLARSKGLTRIARAFPVLPRAYANARQSFIYIDNLCECVRQIVEKNLCGVFCPQDDEIPNASELLEAISNGIGRKYRESRFLGIIMQMLSFIPLVKKAYGGISYSRTISEIEGVNYVVVPFKEGMRRTVSR